MKTALIFKELSAHMVKGLMLHDQMADYYDFLNLHGYKRCHEYHAKCEMEGYRHLHRYYINHFHRLVEEDNVPNPDAIPASWYRYSRQEVDTGTKRTAVKAGIEKWVAWEKETKSFYERMYHELEEAGEIASANFLCGYIKAVDKELKWAERKHIDLATVDYDIGYIMGQQDHLHDWYMEKMGK